MPAGQRWNSKVSVWGALVALSLAIGLIGSPRADAYSRSMKITSTALLGFGSDNLSVAKNGDIYAFRATRTGSVALYHPDIEEFTSSGHKIRTFSTDFHVQGQNLGLVAGGLAATPSGGSVFVSGQFGQDQLSDNTLLPFIGKFSASTGKFLAGSGYSTDPNRDSEGVAVDPSGTHVYVLDVPNVFVGGEHTSRVHEFAVDGLHSVRTFDVSGEDDRPDAIALAPDGHLWVQIEPAGGRTVYDQEYSSSGTFKKEFVSPDNAVGLAFDDRGMIFSTTGTGHSTKIERISTSGQLLQTEGSDSFDRYPYMQTGDGRGDLFAIDNAPATSIVEFKPSIPKTTITTHPPSTLKNGTATFKFTATGSNDTFACRLSVFLEKAPGFTACSSPKVYANLTNQLYAFDVQATSPDGYTDATPAHYQFHVALAFPQTTITSQPPALSGSSKATFKFKSSTSGSSFKCKLVAHGGSASFKSCSSPKSYSGLANGQYTFEAEAISSHGSVDPSPATATFTVDSTPPKVIAPAVTIAPGQAPIALNGGTQLQVTVTASDDHTPASALKLTVEQRVGQTATSFGAWSAVTPTSSAGDGQTLDMLLVPSVLFHQYRVVVQNELGLSATSPASAAFQLREFDNTAPAVTFGPNWTAAQEMTALHGTLARTTTAGTTASLTFTGHAVALIAPLAPGFGSVQACVNGKQCAAADLASMTATPRAPVYLVGGLTGATHTIEVTTLGLAPVAVDGFIVLD